MSKIDDNELKTIALHVAKQRLNNSIKKTQFKFPSDIHNSKN